MTGRCKSHSQTKGDDYLDIENDPDAQDQFRASDVKANRHTCDVCRDGLVRY